MGENHETPTKGTSKQSPGLVSPPVAGIASLILPGLGQVLARQVQRGLILLSASRHGYQLSKIS